MSRTQSFALIFCMTFGFTWLEAQAVDQNSPLIIFNDGVWNDDGSNPGVAEAGETVYYRYTIYNGGSITLGPVNLSDEMVAGSIACPSGNPIPSLAAGASLTCLSEIYTLRPEDLVAGQVDNTVTAISGDASISDTEVVRLPDQPGLSLVKLGTFQDDINEDGLAQAGETILYTFDVTNTAAGEGASSPNSARLHPRSARATRATACCRRAAPAGIGRAVVRVSLPESDRLESSAPCVARRRQLESLGACRSRCDQASLARSSDIAQPKAISWSPLSISAPPLPPSTS